MKLKQRLKEERMTQTLRTKTEILHLEFEGLPPTVNTMYRGLHGHRYKTDTCKKFQTGATMAMHLQYGDSPPQEGRVELDIIFTTASRRHWDIDNRVKALQDCLAPSGVIYNDSQVDILHVERRYGNFDSTQVTLYTLREN